jgi:hypothetical protein
VSDAIVTILAVIGGIVVLFLATSVAFVLYVRWKVRRMFRQLQNDLRGSIESGMHGRAPPPGRVERVGSGARAGGTVARELIDLMRQQQEQVETYTALFAAVRQQAGLDEQEWKRIEDRVVLITDQATPGQIAEAVIESLPASAGRGLAVTDLADELAVGPIRESFEQWNLSQPAEVRFQRIAQVGEPLPADAWLAPVDTGQL